MPWECENERHAYEKCVYTHTFHAPADVWFSVSGASTTSESQPSAPSVQLIMDIFSYMRRMKELSKRKLSESD